jgi:hypothetical protein
MLVMIPRKVFVKSDLNTMTLDKWSLRVSDIPMQVKIGYVLDTTNVLRDNRDSLLLSSGYHQIYV